jgi:hypothetical protein
VRRLAPLLVVALLAACGGGEATTLDRAEDAMAELDAGTMALELCS